MFHPQHDVILAHCGGNDKIIFANLMGGVTGVAELPDKRTSDAMDILDKFGAFDPVSTRQIAQGTMTPFCGQLVWLWRVQCSDHKLDTRAEFHTALWDTIAHEAYTTAVARLIQDL